MSDRNFEDIEDENSDDEGLDLKRSQSKEVKEKSKRDETRTFEGKDTDENESKEPDKNGRNDYIESEDHIHEETKLNEPIETNHISLNFNYAKLHESLADFKKAIIKDK